MPLRNWQQSIGALVYFSWRWLKPDIWISPRACGYAAHCIFAMQAWIHHSPQHWKYRGPWSPILIRKGCGINIAMGNPFHMIPAQTCQTKTACLTHRCMRIYTDWERASALLLRWSVCYYHTDWILISILIDLWRWNGEMVIWWFTISPPGEVTVKYHQVKIDKKLVLFTALQGFLKKPWDGV